SLAMNDRRCVSVVDDLLKRDVAQPACGLAGVIHCCGRSRSCIPSHWNLILVDSFGGGFIRGSVTGTSNVLLCSADPLLLFRLHFIDPRHDTRRGKIVHSEDDDVGVKRLVSRISAARWRIVAACLLIAAACSRVAAARWRKYLSIVVSHHQFGDDGASEVLPSGGGNSFFLILRLTCWRDQVMPFSGRSR